MVDPDTGEEPKLSPLSAEHTIYLRNNPICAESPSKCYTPLVDPENDTGEVEPNPGEKIKTPCGHGITWADSNEDLTATVIVDAGGPLTQEPAARGGGGGGGNLYEAIGEKLKLVNALSNGTPIEKPEIGTKDKLKRNAISADGSHVIFSGGASTHLYERNMTTGKTVQVDKPEEGFESHHRGADLPGRRHDRQDDLLHRHGATEGKLDGGS